ncbi:ROK family transcriptional regulator [Streptomyces omiyaensis]|uniref:ROK family transcriptional regulator n=1 Tax=Streptomyces omiyaensis TaxID=68247 RepID=UPI0036F62A30
MCPAPESPADVRRHNLARVLRHLADHGPSSRGEAAAATGLAHGSLTALTADLVGRGLVREAGTASGGGRGRPRQRLETVPGRVVSVAVRVTRERLHLAVADLAGTLGHRAELAHATPGGHPGALAGTLADAVRETVAAARAAHPGAHLAGTFVAVPGPVTAGGRVFSTDFGWPGPVDLGSLLRERLGESAGPVVLANDANLAALAEYRALTVRRGAAPRSLAYLKADVGVGGGLVLDGRIEAGRHGVAGEPGHMPVAFDGPPCACGGRGCLALYLGPEALTDAAGLGALRAERGTEAAVAALGRALAAGEPDAVAALDAAGEVLGAAVLAVTSLLDADDVVLGGYLADWHPWLARGLEARLAGRRTLTAGAAPVPHPLPGVLGADAPLAGAVALARDTVLADPASVPLGEGTGPSGCGGGGACA